MLTTVTVLTLILFTTLSVVYGQGNVATNATTPSNITTPTILINSTTLAPIVIQNFTISPIETTTEEDNATASTPETSDYPCPDSRSSSSEDDGDGMDGFEGGGKHYGGNGQDFGGFGGQDGGANNNDEFGGLAGLLWLLSNGGSEVGEQGKSFGQGFLRRDSHIGRSGNDQESSGNRNSERNKNEGQDFGGFGQNGMPNGYAANGQGIGSFGGFGQNEGRSDRFGQNEGSNGQEWNGLGFGQEFIGRDSSGHSQGHKNQENGNNGQGYGGLGENNQGPKGSGANGQSSGGFNKNGGGDQHGQGSGGFGENGGLFKNNQKLGNSALATDQTGHKWFFGIFGI